MFRDVRVTFFQVTKNEETKRCIVDVAEKYFEKKEPLLIQLPHQKGLEYVDDLLWNHPQDSFLPHTIEKSNDLIVLSSSKTNPNGARSILNLCPEPVSNTNFSFVKIYELEYLTAMDKKQAFHHRYQTYKARGYAIIII